MKLKQQDIWLAYPALERLSAIALPSGAAIGVARLAARLQPAYLVIEEKRKALVHRFGRLDEASQLYKVDMEGAAAADFTLALGDLLNAVWPEDIPVEKVRLPLVTIDQCPGCGHVIQTTYRIEPQLLMPLAEHFLETG